LHDFVGFAQVQCKTSQ